MPIPVAFFLISLHTKRAIRHRHVIDEHRRRSLSTVRGTYSSEFSPLLFLLSYPFPSLPLPPSLRSRSSEIQLGGMGSTVTSRSRVLRCRVPAEIEFDAF